MCPRSRSLTVLMAVVLFAAPVLMSWSSPTSWLSLFAASAGQREDAGEGYEGHYITVEEGRRVHYLDWGTPGEQPFVMLHGIRRSAYRFDTFAQHFRGDYHVIAMDMRGHGDSDWHPDDAYLVEDYVKDLEVLVEQLDLRDIVLTGASTGGRVAQVYAGLHPDRVAKLIVEDVGPERPESIASGFSRRSERDAGGWASEAEVLESLRRPGTAITEEMLRHWVRQETKRREDGRLVWKYDPDIAKGFVSTQLWEYVSRIQAPTLYVLGGNSTIVPEVTQEQLKATLPRVEVVTVPDAGHYPRLDAPEVYLAIVKAFLAE